jgi:molybdopterin-binding protein
VCGRSAPKADTIACRTPKSSGCSPGSRLAHRARRGSIPTRLSARNRLHGFVDEVRIDGLLAQVRLRVGGQSLTAVITADAVRALKLRRGDDAVAIVKSTEVMIATPGSGPRARGRRAASSGGRSRARR